MRTIKKVSKAFMSVMISMVLVFEVLCAVMPVAMAAGSDYIGDKDYTITNPYKSVDWSTWDHYTGATHVHTHTSDGSENIDEMIEKYYSLGYDALSITDHGTVNYGWTKSPTRLAIFSYQWFVHANPKGLTQERYDQITTGSDRNGRGMTEIPYGIELNGMSTVKCHVNSYFADCGNGDLGTTEDWPESAVAKSDVAGGITHINHVGEWSGGKDSKDVYDQTFVNKFADIYKKYSSCVGMELVNTADNRTKNDRYLYDETLKVLAPLGRNIYGFCEDDSHEFDDCGKNAQVYMLPENNADNIRDCMENGYFFACSKNSKNANELGDGFTAQGSFPSVSNIQVDEDKDQITITSKDANKIRLVADGNVVETYDIDSQGDTVTFDLNKYESSIGSYVRFYLTGEGGICYAQPFLLTSTDYDKASVQFVLPSKDSSIEVYNEQGEKLDALNEKNYYEVYAGLYTYKASRPGYITKTETVSVTDADIVNNVQKKFNITLDEDNTVSYTNFYVPETIYLDPADKKTFKYYLDRSNETNGELNVDANTSGNVYFSRNGASDVSVSAETVSGVKLDSIDFGVASSKNGQLSTVLTYGKMASEVAAGGNSVIKWTASYKIGNETMYSYAYSYVYSPADGQIAAGLTQKHTYSTDVSNEGVLWATGFQAVTGGTYLSTKNYLTESAPTENTGISGWFTSQTDGGSEYLSKSHSSNASDSHDVTGGTGTVTVDTSRNTNLNQIPDLKIGLWECNTDGDSDASCWVKQTVDGVTQELMSADAKTTGEAYNASINVPNVLNYTGSSTASFSAYTLTSRGSRSNNNTYYLNMTVNYVDKQALREKYISSIKEARQQSCYTSSADYNKYADALKEAATVLGNPTSTQTECTTAAAGLDSAEKALVLKTGKITVNCYNTNTSGKLLNTQVIDYTCTDTVVVSSDVFDGYTYSSWSCGSDKGTETYSSIITNSDSYTWNYFYTPNSYNVAFETNEDSFEPTGGTGSTATYDSSYSLPINSPKRTGYQFLGWYLENNSKTYSQGDVLDWTFDSDCTFMALWTANTYSVSFVTGSSDAYTPTGSSGSTVAYNGDYDLPTSIPTKEGYSFAGWKLSADSQIYSAGTRMVWNTAGDSTFTAQWVKNKYTVYYTIDGVAYFSQQYNYADSIVKIAEPSKEGYTFSGWTLPSTMPDNDIIVDASYTANTYTYKFYLNGELQNNMTISTKYGEAITAPQVDVANYKFSGWQPSFPEVMGAENKNFYATLTKEKSNISFNINSAQGTAPDTIACLIGSTPTLPQNIGFAKDGYDFLGWAETADSTVALTSYKVTSEDKTLYAIWKKTQAYIEPAEDSNVVVDKSNCLISGIKTGTTNTQLQDSLLSVVGNGYLDIKKAGKLSTGTVVNVLDNETNEVTSTYTVVIYGDVNCEGIIDGCDSLLVNALVSGMLTKAQVGDAVYMAADANRDGVVSELDVQLLERVGLMLDSVEQN